MNDKHSIQLSEAGEKRKLEILAQAQRYGIWRARIRRNVRNGLTAVTACLVLVLGSLMIVRQDHKQVGQHQAISSDSPPPVVPHNSDVREVPEIVPPPLSPVRRFVDIEYVETDRAILDRYRIESEPRGLVQVEFLDDNQLVNELVAHQLPYGLVKIGNEVRLLPLSVNMQ